MKINFQELARKSGHPEKSDCCTKRGHLKNTVSTTAAGKLVSIS